MVGRLHGKVWGLDLKITSVLLLGQNFGTLDQTKDYVLRCRCNMCSFLLQHNYGIIVLCQIV